MKKLLCLIMFGFVTMSFGMEEFRDKEVGEIVLVFGSMAIGEATNALKEAVKVMGRVNNGIQKSAFGTTVEEGECIEEIVSDDFMGDGDHCTIS